MFEQLENQPGEPGHLPGEAVEAPDSGHAVGAVYDEGDAAADIDTTVVGASPARGLTEQYDVALEDHAADAAAQPSGDPVGDDPAAAAGDEVAEPVPTGAGGAPPETPGRTATAEGASEPEPVDPGFHQYDDQPPDGAEAVPQQLSSSVQQVFQAHSSFVDEVEVAGETIRSVALESTEPDGGGRVLLTVGADGLVSLRGAGNPETLLFDDDGTGRVLRTSLGSEVTEGLPEQGEVPDALRTDLTIDRAELAQGLVSLQRELGEAHVVGADEFGRLSAMIERAVPRAVSFGTIDAVVSNRLESALTPTDEAARRAGDAFANDVAGYCLDRAPSSQWTSGPQAFSDTIIEGGNTLRVQAGFRMDIPRPASPQPVDDTDFALSQLLDATGSGPAELPEPPPLEELPFVRLTYERLITADALAPESPDDMLFPTDFVGGVTQTIYDFTVDALDRLVCTRVLTVRTTEDVMVATPLDTVLCDKTEREMLRNHLNRPVIR